jgi:hypothetical protein
MNIFHEELTVVVSFSRSRFFLVFLVPSGLDCEDAAESIVIVHAQIAHFHESLVQTQLV